MIDYYARLISSCPIINMKTLAIGRVQHGNHQKHQSRGNIRLTSNPTLDVRIELDGGCFSEAVLPSGACQGSKLDT